MALTLNGSNNTIAGVAVGGLPDGIVDTDMIAASAVTAVKRGAGAILQVLSNTKTDVTSQYTASKSEWDTGLTQAITPSHASNKILVTGFIMIGVAGPQHNIGVMINKGGTVISGCLGDAAGSRGRVLTNGNNMPDGSYTNAMAAINFNYLDTGGGTSEIIYGVTVLNPSSSTRTLYMNRADTDTDNSTHYRSASVITVMEVAV